MTTVLVFGNQQEVLQYVGEDDPASGFGANQLETLFDHMVASNVANELEDLAWASLFEAFDD